MQVGIITLDGQQVGVVTWVEGGAVDMFTPDLGGYVPEGRAAGRDLPGALPHGDGSHHEPSTPRQHRSRSHRQAPAQHEPAVPTRRRHHWPGHHAEKSGEAEYRPRGEVYRGGEGGHPVRSGSEEVDRAISDASHAHHLDPNTMRAVASIESSMNPASNANRSTQYKGLYQIGREEWRRFGQGNIYNARENAFAAARMFDANRAQFRQHYGRDPTDAELYMMHQQGLGFYTRGAMTNIRGNPYPGMRGAQSHESFERGWGGELARRKAGFAKAHPDPQHEGSVAPPSMSSLAEPSDL